MVARPLLFFALAAVIGIAQAQVATPEERLFAAIDDGKEIVAEGIVLGGKVNPDARNPQGETPLHRAVEKGMTELVRTIVKSGTSLRARSDSGETALHLAAMHADPALVRLLLDAGSDPKARNDEGETPLHWAALSGNVEVGRLLLERGADPNLGDIKGNRPLHAAADSGNIEMVGLLLSRSSDPKAKNRGGISAEDVANERSRPEVAALISKAVPQLVSPSGNGNFGTIDIDKQPRQRF
jgi:ankyrin repeat protein